MKWLKLYENYTNMQSNKSIYGMIHLFGKENRIETALEEIKIYEQEGLQGFIIENYHGSVTDVVNVLKQVDTTLDIGINILPNEYEQAFSIAAEFGVQFIQLDYVSGVYEGYAEGYQYLNVTDYMLWRKKYPQIKVFGGVWPKYYKPIPDSNLQKDLEKAKILCDAVVVTGSGTGIQTPTDKIKEFRKILGDFPLIIGAGLNIDNISQLNYADGAIVGSSFKLGGKTTNRVDRELVSNFMHKL